MSRIGKLPVVIPQGVNVTVDDVNVITVKGPKGTLTKGMHKDMIIALEDGKIVVTRPSDEKEHRALHGLTRALINNMVTGVTLGFQKVLTLLALDTVLKYRVRSLYSQLDIHILWKWKRFKE